jgi:hypothetical protein
MIKFYASGFPASGFPAKLVKGEMCVRYVDLDIPSGSWKLGGRGDVEYIPPKVWASSPIAPTELYVHLVADDPSDWEIVTPASEVVKLIPPLCVGNTK